MTTLTTVQLSLEIRYNKISYFEKTCVTKASRKIDFENARLCYKQTDTTMKL